MSRSPHLPVADCAWQLQALRTRAWCSRPPRLALHAPYLLPGALLPGLASWRTRAWCPQSASASSSSAAPSMAPPAWRRWTAPRYSSRARRRLPPPARLPACYRDGLLLLPRWPTALLLAGTGAEPQRQRAAASRVPGPSEDAAPPRHHRQVSTRYAPLCVCDACPPRGGPSASRGGCQSARGRVLRPTSALAPPAQPARCLRLPHDPRLHWLLPAAHPGFGRGGRARQVGLEGGAAHGLRAGALQAGAAGARCERQHVCIAAPRLTPPPIHPLLSPARRRRYGETTDVMLGGGADGGELYCFVSFRCAVSRGVTLEGRMQTVV